MMGGFLLNCLGAFHPSLAVAGEILFASALVECQRAMNALTRVPPAVPETGPGFAALIGATLPSRAWRRPAAFALAILAADTVTQLVYARLVGSGTSFGARWLAETLAMAGIAATGAWFAFRRVRNEGLAALTAAAIISLGQVGLFLMELFRDGGSWNAFSALNVVTALAYQFLFLGALTLFTRLAGSIWKSVFLGAACAEFASALVSAVYLIPASLSRGGLESWYQGAAAWVSGGAPERGSYAYLGIAMTLFQPLRALVAALVFTLGLWIAHRLWVRPEATAPTHRPVASVAGE
jgi:hypothetical protein